MTKYLNFKTIGYIILAYVGLTYIGGQTGIIKGVDPAWYNQLFMKLVAGIAMFFLDGKKVTLYNIVMKIYSLFTGNKTDAPIITDDIADALAKVADALNKAGDKDGVALCKTLNGRLFDAMYAKKEVTNVTPN